MKKYVTKSCACGKSEKSFRHDIGPFYVDECCIEAGYDHEGVLKAPTPSSSSEASSPNEAGYDIPGKGALQNMKVAQLKSLASNLGVAGADEMKKKDLVPLLDKLRNE